MPKKRSHGDGGLYQIKSTGRWRGVVDVGFHSDGRRKQVSVSGRTQREARDKLDAIKQEMRQYGAPIDKSVTVEAWVTEWLRTVCAPTMKPGTLRAYESTMTRWVLPPLRRKRVADLRPSDVRTVLLAITDSGGKPSSARKVYAIMSSMLESARVEGLTAKNVAREVTPPTVGDGTRRAFDTETTLRILQTALRRPDGSRWWFAILTGMRQGERLGATLDSVDFGEHLFTVQWNLTEARFQHGCDGSCGRTRAGSCPERVIRMAPGMAHRELEGRLCLVRPKSGKPRTFPLIPALETMIKDYVTTDDRPNPHGLIWRNDDGTPIDPHDDQAEWRSLLLEAGAITEAQALPPRLRPPGTPDTPTTHFARHTTATALMELGVDVKVIGEIVGHVSERTTRGYQHVSTSAARQAMEAIGEHFAGKPE